MKANKNLKTSRCKNISQKIRLLKPFQDLKRQYASATNIVTSGFSELF